jgi:phytanoyl-CoA hydroxylase
MTYRPLAAPRADRYRVPVDEYRRYRRDGFLVLSNLVTEDEVETLRSHADDLLHGRVTLPGLAPPEPGISEADLLGRFTRVHMLHRVDPLSERFLLHPRILDVLEALVGPDVLALQTMLFFNPPGRGGQGWHQDSVYITTYPDTLIGAWLALDPADEENGCLWVAPGSHVEPIYPMPDDRMGFVHSDGAFADLDPVQVVSHLDDSQNTLSEVARRYEWQPVPVEPGDVIFFHAHLLHRSYPNRSENRWRRSFVSHYCNARSWVPWNHGAPFEGEAANHCHILARGTTHLPFSSPTSSSPTSNVQGPKSRRGSPEPTAEIPVTGEERARWDSGGVTVNPLSGPTSKVQSPKSRRGSPESEDPLSTES